MSVAIEEAFPLHRVLNPDGTAAAEPVTLSANELMTFYRWLVTLRTFDQRAWNLQRQGRLGTYAPFSGQEAAQIGSIAALTKDDWVAGSYRDWGALAYHGVPLYHALLNSMGRLGWGYMPPDLNVLPVQVVIAAQILHAVGLAWASKLQEQNRVALTFFGDGATSQGDFHEALNLASVMQVPVVFVCQNNQWAISVPVSRQMATPTIAQRAIAYNMGGIRIDGNDVVAMYQHMREIVTRVRDTRQPVLVEAVTYRLGAHTTADDPTRYRDPAEQALREQADPLVRLRKYLLAEGILTEDQDLSVHEEAKKSVEEAVRAAETYPQEDPAAIFDHVYASLPPALGEQRREFAEHVAALRTTAGEAR